jgi:hypothetical protein
MHRGTGNWWWRQPLSLLLILLLFGGLVTILDYCVEEIECDRNLFNSDPFNKLVEIISGEFHPKLKN